MELLPYIILAGLALSTFLMAHRKSKQEKEEREELKRRNREISEDWFI